MVKIIARRDRRKQEKGEKRAKVANRLDGGLAILISLLSLFLIVGRLFLFTPYQVSGLSMSPTLGDGDKVMVTEEDAYNRGDIIVFNSPIKADETYIKRVVGISGDTVTIKDGSVSVNGEKVLNQEEFGVTESFRETGESETIVPSGELYVLGDNRENSMDSRIFGTIGENTVRGKLFCRLMPIQDFQCNM